MHRFLSSAALAAVMALGAASAVQAQMPQPLPAEALIDAADETKADWLRRHVVAEGPVAGGVSFAFPQAFYENKLILLGESHGVAAPQTLDLELLTHLNARIGLTDYLAEVDPIQAEWLNRYLISGDETYLDRVFDHWDRAGAQWGNSAFEDKMRGVRALNQTLPEARRVRVFGIDAVHDWALIAEWAGVEGLTLDTAALGAAQTAADKAKVVLTALPEAPDDQAGRRLRGLLVDQAAGVRREQAIFNSYRRAVTSRDLGDRPAYGLWGVFHVMQAGINGAKPFAMMVRESDLPAARSMASVVVLSLDSAVQIPAPTPQGLQRMRLTNFNIDGPFVMVKGAATLRAASQPQRIMVFDPSGEGSPFGAGGDFMNIRTSVGQSFVPDDQTLPTSAYAQYIGVFRDSDWAPPRS